MFILIQRNAILIEAIKSPIFFRIENQKAILISLTCQSINSDVSDIPWDSECDCVQNSSHIFVHAFSIFAYILLSNYTKQFNDNLIKTPKKRKLEVYNKSDVDQDLPKLMKP